jgi:Family of unknown function (DUF6326)
MNTNIKTIEKKDVKSVLQTLWIFVMFNYLYCDLLSNMDAGVLKEYLEGHAGNIQINQQFMLGAAILMEIPIAMIVLSRVLKYRPNRWSNIIAGSIMTLVQISSLFVGSGLTLHYIFYSIIEISCTLGIVWYAWKWRNLE